ncbi:hypothetical protein FXO38_22116 [Capsicum annuum]|nr:hypothetical protein FXO38_22116 [Capsicum annuum]
MSDAMLPRAADAPEIPDTLSFLLSVAHGHYLGFCPDEPFELPYCVVTCGSLRVSKLELDGAILKMPNHFEFYQLKLLILVNVELSNEHSASCLFSRCSVLEKLIFDGPTFGTMTLLDITSTSLVYVSILNYVNNRESCSN